MKKRILGLILATIMVCSMFTGCGENVIETLNTETLDTEPENIELEKTEVESTESENTEIENVEMETTELENTQNQDTSIDNEETLTLEEIYEKYKIEIGSTFERYYDSSKLIIMELHEDKGVGLFSIHANYDNSGYQFRLYTENKIYGIDTGKCEYCTHCGLIKRIESEGRSIIYISATSEGINEEAMESISVHRDTGELLGHYYYLSKDQVGLTEVLEEEYKAFLENCEFKPIDENSSWYTDVDSAYENRITIE